MECIQGDFFDSKMNVKKEFLARTIGPDTSREALAGVCYKKIAGNNKLALRHLKEATEKFGPGISAKRLWSLNGGDKYLYTRALYELNKLGFVERHKIGENDKGGLIFKREKGGAFWFIRER